MSNKSNMITDAMKTEFRENGVICLRNVFSTDWIEKVKDGIEYNIKSPSVYGEVLRNDQTSGAYFNDYCNWTRIAEFKDYIFNSSAAEIAGKLMDSKFSVFYHDHVLNKEPGTTKKTPWHHDQSYYPFNGFKNCSIWMPVDVIPRESSLQFVKGSNSWGRLFIPRKFSSERNYPIEDYNELQEYEEMPDINNNRSNFEILSWELQPGDCIVFSMRTLHGADGNLSTTTYRRVLSTRWFGDDITFATRPWTVSPPMDFGLKKGDPPFKSGVLPIVWEQDQL